MASANTPPVVSIGASTNVARVGEVVTLTAFGKDAQQSALTYTWSASDATTLSATSGGTVVFSAMAPGDYVASVHHENDGSASSPPAKLALTVLSATANRPPGMPSVSPLSAALTHAAGAPVSLTLTAKADDPDGDALTYDFAPDPSSPPTFSLMKAGATATFSSSQDGAYVFYVTATDPNGARSPWAVVKILVLPPLSAQPVDADQDRFPPGFPTCGLTTIPPCIRAPRRSAATARIKIATAAICRSRSATPTAIATRPRRATATTRTRPSGRASSSAATASTTTAT